MKHEPSRGVAPRIAGSGFYRDAMPGTFSANEWLDLLMACQDGRATCLRVMEIIDRETVPVSCVESARINMLGVCHAIEALPASEQQTALSLRASAVLAELRDLAAGLPIAPVPESNGAAVARDEPTYFWKQCYGMDENVWHWALCDTESEKYGKVSCAYMVLLADYPNGMDGKPVGEQFMPARIIEALNAFEALKRP